MPLLIVAYPLLAHLATALHEPRLQWAALACLAAVPFYPAMRSRRPGAWLLWIGIAAALYALVLAGGGQYALFVPPVLIPLAAAMLFGESLLPGRTPLISRIARAARGGSLPPELARYTRVVTAVWAGVLVAIALVAAALAVTGPLQAWSLFANVLCYILIGSMFPMEYAWRRWRYRTLEHPGFVDYVRRIARINYRKV